MFDFRPEAEILINQSKTGMFWQILCIQYIMVYPLLSNIFNMSRKQMLQVSARHIIHMDTFCHLLLRGTTAGLFHIMA